MPKTTLPKATRPSPNVTMPVWHPAYTGTNAPRKLRMTIQLQRKPGAPIADGGGDEGPSPQELFDAILGACKAVSLKKGIAVDDVRTEVTTQITTTLECAA